MSLSLQHRYSSFWWYQIDEWEWHMSTTPFPFRFWDPSAIVAAEMVLWSIYWSIKRNWTSLAWNRKLGRTRNWKWNIDFYFEVHLQRNIVSFPDVEIQNKKMAVENINSKIAAVWMTSYDDITIVCMWGQKGEANVLIYGYVILNVLSLNACTAIPPVCEYYCLYKKWYKLGTVTVILRILTT